MNIVTAPVGALVVGLAPANALWVAIAGMWFVGLAGPMFNGAFTALMQGAVTPEMQRRVFTAAGSLTGLASPLGMMVAGPVADVIGAESWFTAAGIACLALSAVIVLQPRLLNMDEQLPSGRQMPAHGPTSGDPGAADGTP